MATKNNKALWVFVCCYYILVMFNCLYASVIWHVNSDLLLFGLGFVAIVLLCSGRYSSVNNKKFILFSIFTLIVCSATQNFFGKISNLIYFLPFLAFVNFDSDIHKRLYLVLKNIIVIIVGVGALFWIFQLSGITVLPGRFDTFGDYEFYNHILYVEPYIYYSIIPRFHAIFIEPGYFGSLLAMILYIEGFNMRDKKNIILLVGLLLTLSLAGYLLGVIGYVINSLSASKNRILYLVIAGGVLFGAYTFALNYNGGDNAVNTIVLSRLEVGDDGNIVGYNRTHDEFNQYFPKFLTSSKLFFGDQDMYDKKFKDNANVGISVFMVMNGLVGLCIYLYYIWYIYRKYGKGFKAFGFLILFFAFFARGHLFALSPFFLLLFCSGLERLSETTQKSLRYESNNYSA